MKLGAQFLCEDFDEYVASVVKAEEAGYAFAWLVDSQILWRDVYVYLTHGLHATERIAGRTTTLNGADVHLRWLDGEAGVPIMMSCTGPRNLRQAGELADRVML